MPASVIIVGSRDQALEELVRASGRVTAVSWAADLAPLAEAQATQPDLVLVDLRRASQIPSALTAFTRQHPATNVLLVLTTLDPALMLQGMRAGANEVLAEPLSAAELDAAVTRLLGQRPHLPAGPVFAFIGAKGGVGTTTTAVNVAATLAKLSPAKALLIDLHIAYGDAAVFLGADARFSVLDALENVHRLDAALLKSLVAHTVSGPDLLASAERPATRHVDVRRVDVVLEVAATQYPFTILDVPRSDPGVLDSLDRASRIVVVANQELATVRNASRMATTLRTRYPKASVTTVINRTDGRAEIGQRDVERAVGSSISHQFPSDYRRALTAMHKGRPLALDNHNQLSASFKALARELAGLSDERTERSTGGFRGLLSGRRS
ncbi:MAG TPA: AAA family ATPase [Vicinamibacterales bacterium]|nr:AAA family ATPase [Vicinamibacterales bacterium]